MAELVMPDLAMPELAAVVAGASLGAMVFFSAVVAPVVFRVLSPQSAGLFLRTLFPRYFLVNGAAAIAAGLLAGRAPASALMILGGLLLIGLERVAVPVINTARDGMAVGVAGADLRFARWHRAAVALNLVEIALLAIAIFLISRGPR